MKNVGKVFVAMTAAVLTAAVAFAIKKLFDSQLSAIPADAIKRKEELTLADIVTYFKNLNLDKAKDTPFISMDTEKYNIRLPEEPKTDEHVLLVGVYEESADLLKDYCVAYCKHYDEALQNVLAEAQDGVVVLS